MSNQFEDKYDSEQTAWVDGHVEQIADFNYDAVNVDRGNPLAAVVHDDGGPTPHSLAGDCLASILEYCWRAGINEPRAANLKFVVLTALVRPGLLQHESYRRIGDRLGYTKAMVSKVAKEIEALWKIHFPRSRPAFGCERMRQARLRQVAAKKRKTPPSGDAR